MGNPLSRPEILFGLFASIANISGIGKKTQESFARIGIERVKDLLFHLPNSCIERVIPEGRLDAYLGRYVILEGIVGGHVAGRTRSAPYRIRFMLENQDIELTYFRGNGKYLGQILPMGETRIISGKLERYGEGLQIIHPDYVGLDHNEIAHIEPQYGLSEGLTQKLVSKSIKGAIDLASNLPEWHREDLQKQHKFPNWCDALLASHSPDSVVDIAHDAPARMRLAYDELLSHQLALSLVRAKRKAPRGKEISIDDVLMKQAQSLFSFEFTGAQKRVINEIREDFSSSKRMFRMVQGDVGAGKTAVAFMAIVAMAGAGFQSALLAPTEILARQHFAALEPMFESLGFKAVLVIGADGAAAKREAQELLRSGKAQIAIGTHAIFQDAVEFANLGLAVIDEQHRFGVNERKRLIDKGGAVDLLAMSATPIPRSLAMAVYGEMDMSILDEKPAGRTPIETSLLASEKLDALCMRIKKVVSEGRQAYWVCPLVSESEFLDYTAAVDRHAVLSELIGHDHVGIVHGQMDASEKAAIMNAFRAGEISVLVATTVIEVGVDVPNASIMVIEGAERFGLSQLHQLRGRVGRGATKSNCILLYGNKISETGRERLELMRQSDDGFFLADADMRMRGAGDLIGTAQSGLPKFKIADLEVHQDLLRIAHDDAKIIAAEDPNLDSERGQALRVLLYLTERDQSIGLLTKS